MNQIALIIFVVIAVVLLFRYMREKGQDTAADSSVESASTQNISQEPEVASEVVAEAISIGGGEVESLPLSSIPEDSALKRHFIQQITAEIEAAMPERPTDSALKRHYDAQVLSSVACKLEALR